MDLFKALENMKYDKRIVEWNVKEGIISQEDYDKYVNSLEDVSSNQGTVELESSQKSSGDEGTNSFSYQ